MIKKIVSIVILLLTMQSIQAQENENPKKNIVEELFKVTKVQEMVPGIINAIINNYKTKVGNVPDSKWNEIANSINYSDFISKTKQLYLDNYTTEELKELIELYKPETITIYKEKNKKVEKQLYKLGSEFGQQTMKVITQKVQAYKKV